MSDITLHLAGNVERHQSSALARIIARIGKKAGKWFISRLSSSLDQNLAILKGYYELSLIFSLPHASAEIKATKKPLLGLKSLINNELSLFGSMRDLQDFELAYVEKLRFANTLIDLISRRLELIYMLQLDLDAIAQLSPETRRELVNLNALRYQALLQSHPDEARTIEEESREWFEAELAPIIE